MPARSRSESETDLEEDIDTTSHVGAAAVVQGNGSEKTSGALAGFRLPLPGLGSVDP